MKATTPHYNLPARSGLSLKPQHFQFILESLPESGFFEIHPENYMSPGGPHLTQLEKICQHYPLSMHGVGMSLGSAGVPNEKHLKRLAELINRFEPLQVSEHLAWSQWNQLYLNDLLPLPYTQESMQVLSQNIEHTQDTIKRKILIENPSTYVSFKKQDFTEADFLNRLCELTGCGLLLDLNNIVVSAYNNDTSAEDYLKEIKLGFIGEVHLAGHKLTKLTDEKSLKIDDHGSHVSDEVWTLLRSLIQSNQQALPLLVEWDTNIPDFPTLYGEALKADLVMQNTLKALRNINLEASERTGPC